MTQTNFTFAQTVIQNIGWTNVNEVLNLDGQFAQSTPISGQTSEFTIGNFLFNVPSTSIVSGVEIELTGYRGATSLPATTLEIWAYDNTNSANAWYQLLPVFSSFDTSAQTFVLGSDNYSFNSILNGDQINNMKFKFVVNGEVYLDGIQVRITYSEPAITANPVYNVCTPILQAQPFYLVKPAGLLDTTIIVDKFQTVDGVDITNVDIPNGYPAVLDQGKSSEENIVIGAVSNLTGDKRQLTISRGWNFRSPISQNLLLAKAHGAGSELVLSNNINFYDLFIRKCEIGSTVSEPISVLDEGSLVADPVSSFDFKGAGVIVTSIPDPLSTNGGQRAIINIAGNTPNTPGGNGGSSGTSGNTQVTTLNYQTHNVSGTDRATIVSISTRSSVLPAASSVTIGGVPMTFLGSHLYNNVRIEDWYMVNTPMGVNTVAITLFNPTYVTSTQYTWTGVDQTTPFNLTSNFLGNSNTATGTGTTTVINSLLVHTLATSQPTITYSAGAGESLVSTSLSGQVQSAIQTQQVGTPSTQTTNINLSQVTDWANLILTVNPTPVIAPVAGQTDIQFQDEGSNLGTTGTVDTVNFTGTGITSSRIGNTVTVNVPGGSGTDEQVKVSATDTTTGYLDDKIEIVNGTNTTVTKTILNPGANEKIQYQIDSTGSSGNFSGTQSIELIASVSAFSDTTCAYNVSDGSIWEWNVAGAFLSKRYILNSSGNYQPVSSITYPSITPPTGATFAQVAPVIYNNNAYLLGIIPTGGGFFDVKFRVIDLLTGTNLGETNVMVNAFLSPESPASACGTNDGAIIFASAFNGFKHFYQSDITGTLTVTTATTYITNASQAFTGNNTTYASYKKTKTNTNIAIGTQYYNYGTSTNLDGIFAVDSKVIFWGTTSDNKTIIGRQVFSTNGNPGVQPGTYLVISYWDTIGAITGTNYNL